MIQNNIHKLIPIIVVIAIVGGFFVGMEYQKLNTPSIFAVENVSNKESNKPESVDFSIFWDVWKKLQESYVDQSKLDPKTLVYGAVDGMVKAVGDPYTNFLPPQQNEAFQSDIKGEFGGIGIEIGIRDSVLTVIAPIDGSPAQKAGLLAGDKIFAINSKNSQDLTISDAVEKIRGEKGTSVVLTINREGFEKPKDFEIKRDTIKIPAVKWEMKDKNIAYIKISTFNANGSEEFKKAAHDSINAGAQKIILDVRNDPGGLLDLAVNISSWFLNGGDPVVSEQFRDGSRETLRATSISTFVKTPTVVLINGGSASASEILAGALHDNRGIILIGEKSFGKGSVQQLADLNGGASLKVTIAKWFTPKGISITDGGIKPDIEVKMTPEDIEAGRDSQLDKALEIIKTL